MTALFVSLGALFSMFERAWPERAHVPYFTRSRSTDWLYWPFSAFVTGNVTRVLTLGAAASFALAFGHRGELATFSAWLSVPRWGIGGWPIAAQLALAISLGDLVNYWNHRLRHTRLLWPFHAIHHSPRDLDWLASVRMHPVDDAIDNVMVGAFVLALGTRLDVWLATGPFLFFFNVWLHANVRWRLGPLEWVIATPAFHRWHHAEERAERPCNFAGVLPLWDLVFGTFSLPREPARAFGPGRTVVPDGLLRQLASPFEALVRRR